MKILIVSYYFPPYNSIGAVRTGKTAKYLYSMGHDVRVLSAKNQPLMPCLPVEVPEDRVLYTSWFNVNKFPEIVMGGRSRVAREGFEAQGTGSSLLQILGKLYKTVFDFPDGQIGWLPYAFRTGSKLIKEWRPDVIYASAMPYTSLVAASRLSKKFDIPWIAELRDLWTDHHNYTYSRFRRSMEQRMESRVLSSASAMVTVSRDLKDRLVKKYGKNTNVILNGFDYEDYPDNTPCNLKADADQYLSIVYTGMLYKGAQDPVPLFEGLKLMGADAERIRISFYGKYLGGIEEIAGQYGMKKLLSVNRPVEYKESLNMQVNSDILLLFLWNDEQQKGIYTGKLFEYIGARRPILAVGPPWGAAAELILQRSLGIVSKDPAVIARQLMHWLARKEEQGYIEAPPCMAQKGLSREEQAVQLSDFLEECIRPK